MKKTYNKKANPARVEQFNAVDFQRRLNMAGKAFEHTARRLQLDGWVLQLINIRKQLETKLEDIPVTHLGSCGPWAPCDGACMDRAHLARSISKVCQLESRLQILLDSHELENEIEQFIKEHN